MIYTIEEIRRRIAPVAVRYHLKAVYLFGSYARGEATDERSSVMYFVCYAVFFLRFTMIYELSAAPIKV